MVRGVAAARGQELRTDVVAVSRAALAPARHPRVNVHYLADLIYGRRPRQAGEIAAEIGLGELGVDGWSGDRRVTVHDGDELSALVAADGTKLAIVQDDLDRRRAGLHRYLRGAFDSMPPRSASSTSGGPVRSRSRSRSASPRSGSRARSEGSTWRRTKAPSSTSRRPTGTRGSSPTSDRPRASSRCSATSRSSSRAASSGSGRSSGMTTMAPSAGPTTTSRRSSGTTSSESRRAPVSASESGPPTSPRRARSRPDESDVWRVVTRQILPGSAPTRHGKRSSCSEGGVTTTTRAHGPSSR